MKTNTRDNIHIYIQNNNGASVKNISVHFNMSTQIIHRHLKKLIEEELIYKEGSPPKVLYRATGGSMLETNYIKNILHVIYRHNGKVITTCEIPCSKEIYDIYTQIADSGMRKKNEDELENMRMNKGKVKANHLMNTFCKTFIQREPKLNSAFTDYMLEHFSGDTIQEHSARFYTVFFKITQHLTKQDRLDASVKLHSLEPLYTECEEKIYIDKLFYVGIDKIDAIKTIQYESMERIKEFQEPNEIEEYYEGIFSTHKFSSFLNDHAIDTFLVIPNNVSRKISFNEYIKERLKKDFPKISHIHTQTNSFQGRKPQKKISGICNRIENASKLFTIDNTSITGREKNILVLDDVFGSGATMNTITKKCKHYLSDSTCIGFALLGSYRKGFDIISGI